MRALYHAPPPPPPSARAPPPPPPQGTLQCRTLCVMHTRPPSLQLRFWPYLHRSVRNKEAPMQKHEGAQAGRSYSGRYLAPREADVVVLYAWQSPAVPSAAKSKPQLQAAGRAEPALTRLRSVENMAGKAQYQETKPSKFNWASAGWSKEGRSCEA